MRVVIIGAGLGGLTLAHGLLAAGVEVAVYERGPRAGAQPASYGIHIDSHGNRALHECLPGENWARYVRAAVPAPDVVRFRDSTLRILTGLRLSTPEEDADPIGHRRAVRRPALHQALTHGLDDVVRWDTTFDRYTPDADGRVQVRFADGSTDTADLLVGADGSNSRVRKQYLPQLVRHDLGILNIAGKVPLDHPTVHALPTDLTDGSVNNVVPSGPGWLFASTWPDDAAEGGYLVWAYVRRRDAYPHDIDSYEPPRLGQWVARQVAGWDPRVAALIGASEPATIATVPLRSMSTVPTWPSSTVTVLGDAIHNMTPMAGVGANTALRDADALRRALTRPGDVALSERVQRYEAEMRGYANTALAMSTRNARNAASDKRLPRVAFRSLLRAADALPAVRHAVFPAAAAG